MVGALDDFGFDAGQHACHTACELRSLIGRIGKQRLQERMHSKHRGEQHDGTVAVLDVGAMNDGVQ